MKKGCLYGIGTGPGNPGLLTFEAGEKITGADILVFPNKEKEKCIAYKIAKKASPEIESKELLFLDFPMTKDKETLEKAWNENGEKIFSLIEEGKNAAFLTIGDPCVYSTFMYLKNYVKKKGADIEIVSGVTSFCAAAALLGITLADMEEEIHIIPAGYNVERSFELSGTLIFMKGGEKIKELKDFLVKKSGEYEFNFYAASNVGLENQKVYKNISELEETAGYLTVVIIKDIKKKKSDGYKFFQNRACSYFPCHKGVPEEDFNCLFCYCPLYAKGEGCGGNFVIKENGVKSCVNCTFPHHRKNYEEVCAKLKSKAY